MIEIIIKSIPELKKRLAAYEVLFNKKIKKVNIKGNLLDSNGDIWYMNYFQEIQDIRGKKIQIRDEFFTLDETICDDVIGGYLIEIY